MDAAFLIKNCDELLRAGRIHEVVRELKKVNTRQVESKWRLSLAKLCRRAGVVKLGLKILAPLVREAIAKLDYRGLEKEIAEYAILLQRNGVVSEAIKILQRLDMNKVPEANLYIAFCLVSRWEYSGSIPYLKAYIESQQEPYSKLIGEVNLAAAYVHTDDAERAESLLASIISKARENSYERLEANAYDLFANLKLKTGELELAENYLQAARKILRNERVHDQLFVQLSQCLIESIKDQSTASLEALKTEAHARFEWESVREAELSILKIKLDEKRLNYLFAGTPHAAYRDRILKELNVKYTPPLTHYLGTHEGPQLDLVTGELNEIALSPAVVKMLSALLRDFYCPRTVGALFSEVYPGEHFDIFTSPNRVHQLVLRTRKVLAEHNFPLQIDQAGETYRPQLVGSGGVLVKQISAESLTAAQLILERAKIVLPADTAFSNAEFGEAVGLKKSQVNCLLAECRREGLIRSIGKGRGIHYRFVSN